MKTPRIVALMLALLLAAGTTAVTVVAADKKSGRRAKTDGLPYKIRITKRTSFKKPMKPEEVKQVLRSQRKTKYQFKFVPQVGVEVPIENGDPDPACPVAQDEDIIVKVNASHISQRASFATSKAMLEFVNLLESEDANRKPKKR